MAGKLTNSGLPAVAKGEVEIAVQPVSELLHAPGIDFVGTVPEEIQFISVFTAAIVKGAKELEGSKRLINFLASEKAAAAIKKNGMEPLKSRALALGSETQAAGADVVKTLRVNGYDLSYIERGSGVPIVLVHGSLNDYRIWAAQMAPFAARYRVISLSLRHYYPERWNGQGDDFSIEQHARDVVAFIRQLGAGKVHLIAHSRGGNVGLLVAKWNPELLRSVVLADATGLEGLLPPGASGDSDANGSTQARKLLRERLQAGEIDRGLAEYIDFTTGPGSWAKMPEDQRQLRRDNVWTIVADTSRPRTTCTEGAKITVPVLLINGEVSPSRYRLMFDAFQGCLKERERVIIPGASHSMFRTHPGVINGVILEFLDRH
jgi:pimeloyl-ACP methyl ester carboxylesterase